MSHIDEFRKELTAAGIKFEGRIDDDGKLHRFTPEGDGENNGWYVLHGTGKPVAGAYGCWKRQINQKWCYRNGDTDPLAGEDLRQAQLRWRQAEAARAIEETARHERGCERALKFTTGMEPARNHPYLSTKRCGYFGDAGVRDDFLVLPLKDADGKLWSYQTIDSEGDKLFMSGGRVKGCFYTVCDRIDGPLVICEGYATGQTIYEATGFAVVCAMNCGNLMDTAATLRERHKTRKILIAADNDRFTLDSLTGMPSNPGLTKAREAAKKWSALVVVPEIKGEGTDFNDMAVESGLNSVLATFEKSHPSPLSLLTFDQIAVIPHSEGDRILGDHVLDRGSSMTLIGAGGTGKSRLALQFVAACLGGQEKFLNFDIHPGARNMKWMIFQSENSARRLKSEGEALKKWLGSGWNKFNEMVRILTPINEIDTFLNLDSPENLFRLQASLEWFMPDGVIFDSLYDFGIGDLSKDSDMRASLIALSRLCRYRNPKRALIVLHHSLTGAAGAAKSTGFDRSSFARNSKVIYNWTRCQINVAPMLEDNNSQLAVSCGKLSDGREFPSFAINLNPETMIYECDESVDVKEWANEMRGVGKDKPLMTSEEVASLCRPAMTRTELSEAIQEHVGVGKTASFRYIVTALGKTIKESDRKLFKK